MLNEAPNLGLWIKERRRVLRFTQEELADRAGCSRDAVSKIEQGNRRPSLQLAEILASVLKVPAEESEAFIELARAGPSPYLLAKPAPTNLRTPLTSFVGRGLELLLLQRFLLDDNVRLITLVGPPGIGKTRLASEAALDALDAFRDGTYFVDLAPIGDPSLVVPAIAETLGVKETAGKPLIEVLRGFLQRKQILLLLDNIEQVIEARDTVIDLLSGTRSLKVLVTSRIRLQVRGEHQVLLPPLDLPPVPSAREEHLPVESLVEYNAVRLFIDRARSIRVDFDVDDDSAFAIAQICYHLDGLPLAIELAAARVNVLSPAAILARLSGRLTLLSGAFRDLPAHQRTLRDAIEWSFDLLSDEEKLLFRRLCVFSGGFTLEAVKAVCADHSRSGKDPLEIVSALVNSSLLRTVEGAGDEPRFGMLETIHEYAREQLGESGEAAALSRRHALYFMSLAERAEPEVRGPQQVEWFQRLDDEHDNFRAALAWARNDDARQHGYDVGEAEEAMPVEIGLRTAAALQRYWYMRNHFSEGREHLHSLLDLDSRLRGQSSRLALRARALIGEAALAERQDQVTLAWELNQDALVISRALGDTQGIALALHSLAACGWITDLPARLPLLEESRSLFEELDDTWNLARATHQIGAVAEWLGDGTRAKELYLRCQAMFEQVGDIGCVAHTLINTGMVYANEGDYDSANSCIKRSVALNERIRNRWGKAVSLLYLANVSWLRGDLSDIRSPAEEAAAIFRDSGAMDLAAQALLNVARVHLLEDNLSGAAMLLDESLNMLRAYRPDVHEPYLEATILYFQGLCAKKRGAPSEAARSYRESLSVELPQGGMENWRASRTACTLASLAELSLTSPVRAAMLAGAAHALMISGGRTLPYDERIEYEQNLAATCAPGNGDPVWQAAWEAGQALSRDEAVARALNENPLEPGAEIRMGEAARHSYATRLSPREVEVLHLLAEGLSNQQIAERLFLRGNTVRAHLHSIYSKLDVSTRSAAIRFATDHGLL